jgi:hypothetical protein
VKLPENNLCPFCKKKFITHPDRITTNYILLEQASSDAKITRGSGDEVEQVVAKARRLLNNVEAGLQSR